MRCDAMRTWKEAVHLPTAAATAARTSSSSSSFSVAEGTASAGAISAPAAAPAPAAEEGGRGGGGGGREERRAARAPSALLARAATPCLLVGMGRDGGCIFEYIIFKVEWVTQTPKPQTHYHDKHAPQPPRLRQQLITAGPALLPPSHRGTTLGGCCCCCSRCSCSCSCLGEGEGGGEGVADLRQLRHGRLDV